MDMKIIDEDGTWFTNAGAFPFNDPISGTRFEPGVRTKVKTNAWIEGQPVLVPEAPAPKAVDKK